MFLKALTFWFVLLIYQFLRFLTIWGLASGDLQAYLLWFACGLVGIDIIFLRWLFSRMELNGPDGNLAPLGARDPYGIAILTITLYLCASAFASTVYMINGTDLLLADGPRVGPISIAEAGQHPQAGVLEFTDGILKPQLQGAVKYNITSRVTEYFYAVPLVAKSWTVKQPVSVWAILGESDMSAPDLHNRRFGYVVHAKNIHHAAFAKAVEKAEERSAIHSALDAILVRLSSDPPSKNSAISSQTKWIGLIYLGTWLLTGWFAFRAFSAPIVALAKTPVQSDETTVIGRSNSRPMPQQLPRRLTWLVIHMTILTVLILGNLYLPTIWMSLCCVLGSILFEIWWVYRSFLAAWGTQRYRAQLVVFPLSLIFCAMFTATAAEQLAEVRGLQHAKQVDFEHLEINTRTRFIEFTDKPQLRGDQAGYFYAPNRDAASWWMVPVVPENWTPAMPVKVWMQTTNRDKAHDLKGPLHYGKLVTQPLNMRAQESLNDAVKHHHLKSAPDALVVVREHEIRQQRNEAGVLIVLAVSVGFLGWIVCACYWPILKK
jgi:hypothetical protein